jgi:ribonuclease D
MSNTIWFKRECGLTVDPLMDRIRIAARAEGWAGMAGLKQWAKETCNATLRTNKYRDRWTSISFRSEEDLKKFKQHFGVEE